MNLVMFVDERGVGFAKRGTYGTARWLRESDIEKSEDLELTSIDDAKGIILAQIDEDAKRVVCLSRERRGNFNVGVIGGPGSGKSAGYVRANILQSIKIGNSVIVTDPKGELFTSLYPSLIARGIEVKAFNLKDPEYSDSWDCLGEVFDPLTEQGDVDRATEFATIIIENTGGQSLDPVYSQGAHNLLKATILLATWHHEQLVIKAYNAIYEDMRLAGYIKPTEEGHAKIKSALSPRSESTLRQKRELLEKILQRATCPQEERDAVWKRYMDTVPECSLTTIYQLLASNTKDSLSTGTAEHPGFDVLPEGHPGKIAFHFFNNNNEKLKDSFLGGLGIRLQLLQSQAIRRITRNKDIDLARPGETQVVYFLIIPDQSKSTRTLSSMFFNFLFKDLCDAADTHGSETRRYVDIICDEFKNIGMIPDFDTKITIVRSRRIGISILFQMPSQIIAVYGEDNANTILGGCDTLLFLGSSDDNTKEMISKKSGEATIAVNTVRSSYGIGQPEKLAKDYQESSGEGKRNVLTTHEVGNLSDKECLIFLKGHNVLKANKFWWWQHPDSRDINGNPLPSMLITDYDLSAEKYKDTEDKDAFLASVPAPLEYEVIDDVGDVLENGSANKHEAATIGRLDSVDDNDFYYGITKTVVSEQLSNTASSAPDVVLNIKNDKNGEDIDVKAESGHSTVRSPKKDALPNLVGQMSIFHDDNQQDTAAENLNLSGIVLPRNHGRRKNPKAKPDKSRDPISKNLQALADEVSE